MCYIYREPPKHVTNSALVLTASDSNCLLPKPGSRLLCVSSEADELSTIIHLKSKGAMNPSIAVMVTRDT